MTQDLRGDVFARGYQTFMGLTLKVAPGVLIPRAETELLGATAIAAVESCAAPKIIDMCAGSGNLACALAAKIPGATVWASDASPECVELCRANAEALGAQDRVTTVVSNLFEQLRDFGLTGTVDLVVCNPPYISSHRLETQSNWLLENEPRRAFDGGPYGLSIITRLVRTAPEFLRADGFLCFEFGEGQDKLVVRTLESSGFYHSVKLVANSAGVPRVAVAQRKTAHP